MTAGALICLGLVGLQLGAQMGMALHVCLRKLPSPRCPPVSTNVRRDYLDRKADIERDARRRL